MLIINRRKALIFLSYSWNFNFQRYQLILFLFSVQLILIAEGVSSYFKENFDQGFQHWHWYRSNAVSNYADVFFVTMNLLVFFFRSLILTTNPLIFVSHHAKKSSRLILLWFYIVNRFYYNYLICGKKVFIIKNQDVTKS